MFSKTLTLPMPSSTGQGCEGHSGHMFFCGWSALCGVWNWCAPRARRCRFHLCSTQLVVFVSICATNTADSTPCHCPLTATTIHQICSTASTICRVFPEALVPALLCPHARRSPDKRSMQTIESIFSHLLRRPATPLRMPRTEAATRGVTMVAAS